MFFLAAVGTACSGKPSAFVFLRVSMWRYVQIRRLRFVSVYKNLNEYAKKEFIPRSFSIYLYFGAIMVCTMIQS